MKRSTMLTLLVVLSIALVAPAWCRDVVVSLHNHTLFSDGAYTISEVFRGAIMNGAEAVVINDHAEKIDSTEAIFGLPKLEFGVDSWMSDMSRVALNSNGHVLVYGMELGLGTDRKNHMLVLAPVSTSWDNRSIWKTLCDKMRDPESTDDATLVKAIQECRALIEMVGGVAIAAHPTNEDFLFKGGALVDAYEIFNHGDHDSPRDLMEYVLSNSGCPPRPKTIVAGSDFHFDMPQSAYTLVTAPWGYSYVPSLLRFTVVQADDVSARSIVAAMREHRCYAAFGGARIRSMTVMPGHSMPAEGQFIIETIRLIPYASEFRKYNVSTFFCVGPSGQTLTWDEEIDNFGFGGMNASCRTDFDYRFKDKEPGIWQMYVFIAGQIMTSAIEIHVKSPLPQIVQESAAADSVRATLGPPDLTPPQPEFVGDGRVYRAQKEWQEDVLTATYAKASDTKGRLTLASRYAPPRQFDVQLAKDNCGLMSWTLEKVQTVIGTASGPRQVVATLYVQDGGEYKDVVFFNVSDVYDLAELRNHPEGVGGFLGNMGGKSMVLERVQQPGRVW